MHTDDSLILERLDRAYMSQDWFMDLPDSRVLHQPIFLSDHAAIILDCTPISVDRFRPYQLENWCLSVADIRVMVDNSWSLNICGSPMFSLSRKLAYFKKLARRWCLNNKREWGINWSSFVEGLSSTGTSVSSVSHGLSY